MRQLQIKVCGITRIKDARLAVKLGVDMLGFIFYRKSPRWIALRDARTIMSELPATVDRVGVFVNEELNRVIDIGHRLRLDYVQLHGRESASYVAAVRRSGLKVIKAYSITKPSDYATAIRSKADLVLLDHAGGGTGTRFDWSLQPPRRIRNLVLAGGVGIDNVAEGIARFRPMVVDVNSSVESSPGRKSARRLKTFMDFVDSIRYNV
jgi:phosphoribosylanthranilate isomerase